MNKESSRFRKGKVIKVALIAFVVLAAVIALVACSSTKSAESAKSFSSGTAATANTKIGITTSDATVAISAEQWQKLYPNEYGSMQLNSKDDSVVSYLDLDPFLTTIYEGTPFSKDYDVARGHTYDLTDVQATQRISDKTKAVCYACKGSYYPIAELQDTDGSLYKTPFASVDSSKLQPISCYDCHLNNPAGVGSSRQFFNNAFPQATIKWGASVAACGQCHNEYYFDATTGAVMLPPGLTSASDILDYYNSINFVDYTNPRTGVKQLKAQHPEVQTFAGSMHQKAGLTCADCHMERLTDSSGNVYSSHELVDPFESETIQQNVCARCHSDVKSQLSIALNLVTTTEAREKEVGTELETLTNTLADAVTSGKYTDEELDNIRYLNRCAQWYWDFEFVENSSGFHNPAATTENLDTAEDLCQQAMALLNK